MYAFSPKKKKKAGRGYDISIKPEAAEPPPAAKTDSKLPPIQVEMTMQSGAATRIQSWVVALLDMHKAIRNLTTGDFYVPQ